MILLLCVCSVIGIAHGQQGFGSPWDRVGGLEDLAPGPLEYPAIPLSALPKFQPGFRPEQRPIAALPQTNGVKNCFYRLRGPYRKNGVGTFYIDACNQIVPAETILKFTTTTTTTTTTPKPLVISPSKIQIVNLQVGKPAAFDADN